MQIGSAQLAATGAVDGFAIFHQIPTAQEAVVPMETRNASSYLLAFDNTNGIVLGVAVENVSAQAANIGVVIRDDTGTQYRHPEPRISLGGNGHTSFVLSDRNVPGHRQQTRHHRVRYAHRRADQRAGYPLHAAEQRADHHSGAGQRRNQRRLHRAHRFGGDGWQTTFVLVNAGASAAQVTSSFFADVTGTPLSLPLSFPQSGNGTTRVASSVDQTLAAGATFSRRAPRPYRIQCHIGSAQLTTTAT